MDDDRLQAVCIARLVVCCSSRCHHKTARDESYYILCPSLPICPSRKLRDTTQIHDPGIQHEPVINLRPSYVLDADIASCFDTIDQAALLEKRATSPLFARPIKE